MQEDITRIGISGGTFNPIHFGHLIIAEQVREKFNLDKILFIPAGIPPHKDLQTVTESEHRYNMVCSSVTSNPYFEVSRIELDRQGFTYTIDTISYLRSHFGENVKLFFIIGADVVWDLLKWREPEKLLKMCEFIAVMRHGYEKSGFIKEIEYLKAQYLAKIHIAEAPLIDISSTNIRKRVAEGRSIKYLVPESVEKYIMENRLYT